MSLKSGYDWSLLSSSYIYLLACYSPYAAMNGNIPLSMGYKLGVLVLGKSALSILISYIKTITWDI
jgi:hypothetical protein